MKFRSVKFERNDRPTRQQLRVAIEDDLQELLDVCRRAGINCSEIEIRVQFKDPSKTGEFTAEGTAGFFLKRTFLRTDPKPLLIFPFDVRPNWRNLSIGDDAHIKLFLAEKCGTVNEDEEAEDDDND